MLKKFFQFILIVIVLLAGICFYAYSEYRSILNANIVSNSTTKKVFEIKAGQTASQVLLTLKEEEVISEKQETALKIYMKFEKEPQFKIGTFRIALNTPLKDLVTLLETPDITDIWVTIPEGLRKDEIASIITKEFLGKDGAVFSEKEFLKLSKDSEYIYSLGLTGVTDLEGYLFPDKYLMPSQATTDYVIRTLVSTFKQKAGNTTYNQLIIASILEREGLNDKDRPMISDVIRKRLSDTWPTQLLQMDAINLYHYKDWNRWKKATSETIQADKAANQPYNSYLKPGLPPTPICNPGLSSINAAKNPKKNNYYFYIHDNNGNVYFATTQAEHEANIFNYLR